MRIKNVKVYTADRTFQEGSIYIEGERFAGAGAAGDAELDGEGCYAIPGLIDLHFHGCRGADFCDGSREALQTIAAYEASVGVTAIAPATMTLPAPELLRILRAAAEYREETDRETYGQAGERGDAGAHRRVPAADLVGINMEGPFISKVKKGAQDEANIIPCDVSLCEQFLEASKGLVRFVGIAPEESGNALEFIRAMRDKVHISLAHTNADYDTADAAFRAGADHAVHLYNAMPPFTHRAPGVVGAVADHPHVWAELICDGVHIHPAVVRSTFRMLGGERILLISDSMRATGMPDGVYTLGGLDVQVKGNRAELVSDGALAGSVTNLMDCMRTAVREMGIPLGQAVGCATINPAVCLGIEKEYGSIAPGKYADLVLLDPELNVKMIMKKGSVLQSA